MLAKGQQAIRQCEARLRELMAQASSSGQYEAVGQLMEWAKSIASVLEPLPAETRAAPAVDVPESDTQPLPSPPAGSRKGKPRKQQYPRFGRFRNELVKTGWSKKDKKEYQHRAPRQVVDLLRMKLERFRGKDFTSDELLPLSGDDGQEVPSYQAYLCLAWFRETAMIVKNGRQGYFVDGTADLKAAVEQHWQQLKQQR